METQTSETGERAGHRVLWQRAAMVVSESAVQAQGQQEQDICACVASDRATAARKVSY